MITRPSTPRILEDVCEELLRDVMPGITDVAAQIRMQMLISVLNNCANASGSEIALMREETALYVEYAEDVAEATGAAAVREAVEAARPHDSLYLADVAADYSNAGRAFSAALDAAMDRGDRARIERGEELLRLRMANERTVLSGSSSLGRSAS